MNDVTIPDFMPVLSKGAHSDPREGACLMEMISMLAGEPFSDSPDCTHPVLARAAQVVNDRLPDEDRHLLVPLIGRLFGTADTRDDQLARQVLSVRLAAWCARHVAHLVREQDRAACVRAVDAAEAWADKPSADAAATAAARAAAATAAARAADAADAAYAAAAYAARAAAAYADAATAAAATAAARAAAAANADSLALVGFLTGLLDRHAELTGHQPRDIHEDELRALAAQVG